MTIFFIFMLIYHTKGVNFIAPVKMKLNFERKGGQ